MGNKGIKLVKPIKINLEKNAGLDWKLDDFMKRESFIPDANLMYINSKGEPSIRFTDYNYVTHRDIEEKSILKEVPLEGMNIEVILEEVFISSGGTIFLLRMLLVHRESTNAKVSILCFPN